MEEEEEFREEVSESESVMVEGETQLLRQTGMLGEERFSSDIVIQGCLRISSSVGLSQARRERHL